MAATTTSISLKILLEPKSQKVLFAEAGKDFVDFLFNILSLPVGTVIRLLTTKGMVGCLGNLYDSIENLDDNYMERTANKDMLLKPMVLKHASNNNAPLLLPNLQSLTISSSLYRCKYRQSGGYGSYATSKYENCRKYVTNVPTSTNCPSCNRVMNQVVTLVNPAAKEASSMDEGGYVKGVVTYMIMDDLVVKPMSTISSITILKKFNVKDARALQEKVIDVGMNEGVELLKRSLQSQTVLTDVFFKHKASRKRRRSK